MAVKVKYELVENRFPQVRAYVNKQATVNEFLTLYRIAAKARIFAPVLTGALKDSIQVEEEHNAVVAGDPEEMAGTPGAVDYAFFVEFGTVFMAAEPFFTPAIQSEIPGWLARNYNTLPHNNWDLAGMGFTKQIGSV